MEAQVDMLTAAFSSFGTVQNVKLVRDKGGIADALVPCHHCVCVYAVFRGPVRQAVVTNT